MALNGTALYVSDVNFQLIGKSTFSLGRSRSVGLNFCNGFAVLDLLKAQHDQQSYSSSKFKGKNMHAVSRVIEEDNVRDVMPQESVLDRQVRNATDGNKQSNRSEKDTSSGLDRIENQAKASLDKLKHILYKLKTRSNDVKSPVVNTEVLSPDSNQTTSPVLAEDEREVFISQKFEVELASGELDNSITQPEAGIALQEMSPSPTPVDADSSSGEVYYDSLTCTRTTVHIDEALQTAIVTVSATVRAGDLADSNAYTEITVAMAARALARTCLALDEKAQLAVLGTGPLAEIVLGSDLRRHNNVLENLDEGEVISHRILSAGYGSTVFRQSYDLRLRKRDGTEYDAVFKPMLPGDFYGRWMRAPPDWVAYQVALLIGVDTIPPAVIRRDIRLGSEIHSMGVMIYKVPNLISLKSLPLEEWNESSPRQAVCNVHILDALIGNSPRKPKSFMAGNHWEGDGKMQLVVIDHPMGPGKGDLHSMWGERGHRCILKDVSPVTLTRLRSLNREMLLEGLNGALSPSEMELILERKDQILAYFDAIQSRKGRHLVVV